MTTEDTENTERENDLQCELAAWELLHEAEGKYTALATEHMLAINKLAEERDKAREDLEFRRGLYRVQEECLENAREQIKKLIYIAESAIALAEIDFENDKFGVVSELRDEVERIKEGAK